ncbi:CLUMA_CG017415, isoform A [Clunio marinus]|uniref:Small ribosomal subunit protein mS39 n=1 Tax=Clunio marinus TaxID=568069 RepID=A0A1J1IW38_9DIPT|nr:CLUMA_CG017415, isoform A [Clunio marinus]
MHNIRRSFTRLPFIRKQTTWNCKTFATTSSSSSSDNEEIKIPNRIKRSPTDLLKALSQTVGYDPTAPHYKFHDDPFLIPTSNIAKRTFALAQESGRKSAKWIRQENWKLFQHTEMDPPIEAFVPTKIYTEESEVEVKDLESLIAAADVTDAALVYQLLQKNKIEIPAEVMQSFFELICFFNNEEQLDEDLVEERWFRMSAKLNERPRKTWKDYDLAEQIFSEIDPKDSKAYSTIIRGMCKYYQAEKAYAFFNEALANNIALDVETFNSILSVVSFLREGYEARWDLMRELLITMKSANLNPNQGTLNSCLSSITTMGGRTSRDNALKILGEFKRIGIQPSLASWYYILQIFCRERGPVSHVLIDIMNEIEGKEFEIKDLKDCHFFVTAMDVCRNHLHDKNLAKRVDALLHHGDNYNLIGDSYKESVYYRNFFLLLLSTEPFEIFMDTYHYLVPNVYIPEPVVMEEILKSIEVSGSIETIPLIWSHMILFDHTTRENLLNMITKIMIENKPNPSLPRQENLVQSFGDIAYDIWKKIEEKNEMRTKQMIWTARLLSDILTLICRIEDFEKATEIFDKIIGSQDEILGDAEITSMQNYVQVCILKKQPEKAVQCLQFCTEIGFPESKDMAKTICSGFTLDENLLKKVAYLAGEDVLNDNIIS